MMESRQRVWNLLARKPVDRSPFFEAVWRETETRWRSEGHFASPDQGVTDRLDMDIELSTQFNTTARIDFQDIVVEEDVETRLTRDGNGALMRRWKNRSGTPEHVDYLVKERAGWEEHIRPFLTPDPRRIDFEEYRRRKSRAAAMKKFFMWRGVSVFELMHRVCGHECVLMNMALDPGWVKDMARGYVDLILALCETLFSAEGPPDGVWIGDDLGLKERPFMSPTMYREIIQPFHARTIGWFHERGLKVILHSCGYVEPLMPHIVAAGIDVIQPMEVKAGMDMVRLNRLYGEKIGFMGNIDIREMLSNDRRRIEIELRRKILPLMATHTPYILCTDHSTPPGVDFDTFLFFRDCGLGLTSGRSDVL